MFLPPFKISLAALHKMHEKLLHQLHINGEGVCFTNTLKGTLYPTVSAKVSLGYCIE